MGTNDDKAGQDQHPTQDETSLQQRVAQAGSALQVVSLRDEPAWSETDDYEPYPDAHEEEDVVEMTEAELIEYMDSMEDPLITCSRLFHSQAFALGKMNELGDLTVLTPQHVAELKSRGFVVLDDVIPRTEVAQARVDAESMQREDSFQPSGQGASATYTDTSARSDRICWLHKDKLADDATGLQSVMCVLDKVITDLGKVILLRRQAAEFQLAMYGSDGAYYERHRDALPDGGLELEQRRVTVILYMNDDWTSEHGGCLRVWPPKQATTHDEDTATGDPLHASQSISSCDKSHVVDGQSVVDLAPIAGRLVVFLSGAVDHEVLPSHADRFALTAWCQ